MSKRLTEEEKQYQKRQATVGLASNVLGIAAGTAALATASKNKAFKRPNAETAGPVTSKVLRKITMSPANQKRLILAGAGGAVGLQAANLGGDLVTNRVLTREVHKNDQSMISKAEGGVSNNGHGKSINLVGIPATVAGTAIAASGASKIKQSKAGVKDSARYAVLADRNAKNAKKFDADLKRSLKENKVLAPIYNESMKQVSLRNAQHFKSKEKEALSHAIKMNRGGRLFVAGGATLAGAGLTERAYRNAQLKKKSQEPTKVGIMSKNDQSMISKSEGSVSHNGHGKSLVDKAFTGKENTRETVLIPGYGFVNGTIKRRPATKGEKAAGTAYGAALGGAAGGLIATARNRPTNKVIAIGAGAGSLAGAALGYAGNRKTREFEADSAKHSGAKHRPGKYVTAREQADSVRNTNYMAQRQRHEDREALVNAFMGNRVTKAYRRFDPEADRQRRAGLYTGVGVLGAGLAGREAATKFTTRASTNGSKVRGIVAKPGKGKAGLGLAALAAASGAFGAQSYKSGLSSRNQPWT